MYNVIIAYVYFQVRSEVIEDKYLLSKEDSVPQEHMTYSLHNVIEVLDSVVVIIK